MCRGYFCHAFQHLQPTLRLAGFRCLVAKSVHIALDMLNFGLLARVHGLLLRELLRSLRFELTVVARKQVQLLVLDVGNACTNFIEEISIVRNHHQYPFVAFQPALQPQYRREVEVIGRLIE